MGKQISHRDFENRPHDDEHDARRNQDSERATRRDTPRRKGDIVTRLVHGFSRHDAEYGDRGTHNSGRGSEDGGDKQYRDIQRTVGSRKRQLYRLKQSLHQARLLHQNAHKYEQGYGGKRLFKHDAGKL